METLATYAVSLPVCSPMSTDEARSCVEQINAHINGARSLLLDLYERNGWEALGYSSWRECAIAEIGLSERRVYQLLDAAQVERNICTVVQIGTIPERHLRSLVLVEPERQQEVYQTAVATAPNGKVTAAHIDTVAREFTSSYWFTCDQCQDRFALEVWHCPRCDHHWDMNDDECGNCHEFVRSEWTTGVQQIEVLPDVNRLAALMSSATPEWYTPQDVIDRVISFFDVIELDPCSNSNIPGEANVPAIDYWTAKDDGLVQPWWGRVYMNPPYGDQVGLWVKRLVDFYDARKVEGAIALIPARTDTAWFSHLWRFPLCFVRGRLKFSGAESSAPFPSVVAYLGDDIDGFVRCFGELGPIVTELDRKVDARDDR